MSDGINRRRFLSAEQIQKRVVELGEWFHNMDLDGVKTAPGHFLGDYPMMKWRRFAHAVPPDLRGKTVLDIGCNAGFYSIEMKCRGAERVVAIDSDEGYLDQARFAAEVCGVEIEFLQLSVYDIARLESQFDIILFMGVLYHLRHPMLALDLIRKHVFGELLIFQSMVRGYDGVEQFAEDYPFSETEIFSRLSFPRLHFVERKYAGDPTNWWIPNRACVEGMLRSAGFRIADNPEPEVYFCTAGETESGPDVFYPDEKEVKIG